MTTMKKKRWTVAFATLIGWCTLVGAARAAEDTVGAEQILREVKSALESSEPSVRTVKITLSSVSGADQHWRALQAWKPLPNGMNRMVMVMTDPLEVRGSAILIQERADAADVQWVWLPAVGRVRKLLPIGRFEGFLGTDFTYADLGFLSLRGRVFDEVESTKVAGVDAYLVRERITDNPWYYSRIETLVAKKDLSPIERRFFDQAGDLWKRELFEKVEPQGGIQTIFTLQMKDELAHTSSTVEYDEVRYRDAIPESVFDPERLPALLKDPIWSDLDLEPAAAGG
jgi:hypothetical protein